MRLETVIGLEIHLQLNTKSKLFCSCANKESHQPNKYICPICLGHPGTLPVINKEAIKKILTIGLALQGDIAETFYFDRKNYFYPDLPKGYQISQYNMPLIKGGYLDIKVNNKIKKIHLHDIHLEEDTAKIFHLKNKGWSFLDFNRAGVPLVEIVTNPEIESPGEAKIFLEELQLLAQALNISNAEMEKGEMRCDANISLRPVGSKKYFPKIEIKNLNSFKAVKDALSYQIKYQTELWQKNIPPKNSSTWGWDKAKKVTILQRGKEEICDYRYFPEPDLPILSSPFNINKIRKIIPELPIAKRQRFQNMYGFSPSEAKILIDNKTLADFAEKVISELKAWLISLETVEGTEEEIWFKNKKKLIKLVANWLINRLLHLMNKKQIKANNLKITPENFSEFIILIYEKKISSTLAEKILEKMFISGQDPDHLMHQGNIKQINDKKGLNKIIENVINENPDIVKIIQKGKINAVQFLIGQTMKKSKGLANPKMVRQILKIKLGI